MSVLQHERLITFRTFSKAWGLAALRLGWLAASPAMCREIRKVRLPYNLNVISEAAAIVALERADIRDANVARIVAERERVARAMAPLVETFPSAANFIAFRPRRDCKEVFEELYARGILIRDVSSYPRMPNCLRVSIGRREENDRFLEALRSVIASFHPSRSEGAAAYSPCASSSGRGSRTEARDDTGSRQETT